MSGSMWLCHTRVNKIQPLPQEAHSQIITTQDVECCIRTGQRMLQRHRRRASNPGAASQKEFCQLLEAPSMLRVPWMLVEGGWLCSSQVEESPLWCLPIEFFSLLCCSPTRLSTEPSPPPTRPLRQLNDSPQVNTTSNSREDNSSSPFLASPALLGPPSAAAGLAFWPLRPLCGLTSPSQRHGPWTDSHHLP